MKFNDSDHTPEQLEALAIVDAWRSPRFFDALLKNDDGRYTPAAAAARLSLTQGDGQLRPLHIIREMISADVDFAKSVIEGNTYLVHLQSEPTRIGALLDQQHEILDSALKDQDTATADKSSMYIRLMNAVLAERTAGIDPAAVAAQKDARGEGLAL